MAVVEKEKKTNQKKPPNTNKQTKGKEATFFHCSLLLDSPNVLVLICQVCWFFLWWGFFWWCFFFLNEPSSPPQSPCVTALMSLALLMLLEIASSPKITLHTHQHHFLSGNCRDGVSNLAAQDSTRIGDGPIFYKHS